MNADATIVVIGGSSGIGLAVARRSLADGAAVVIAGRSQHRLDAARAELARAEPARAGLARTGADAGRLSAYPADICDLAQVTRLFERVGTLSRLPAGRLGRPGDIANAVAFLIADDFVTGTVLHAEGAQILV